MPALLGRLGKRFDLIIVDTPALEAVSESLVIASACESAVMVVRAGSTPVAVTQQALAKLRQVNRRVLGVIVNRHDFAAAERYHGEPSRIEAFRHYVPELEAAGPSPSA